MYKAVFIKALTFRDNLRLAENNMLGQFKSHEMITGDFRSWDSITSVSASRGAEADSAMNGALVRARIPPIILKDFLKSCPL